MPKSFLITNKRYKGDVLLIQKNAVTREDELIRTTRPLTTDPDDRIPDSSSPATDASGEDSGSSSGKENEIDVEELDERHLVTAADPIPSFWSGQQSRDSAVPDTPSPPSIRPPEAAGSGFGGDPVDWSVIGRPSRAYDVTPPPAYFRSLFPTVVVGVGGGGGGGSSSGSGSGSPDPGLGALVARAWAELGPGQGHGCPDCGRRYSTASNLARHRQTHRSLGDRKARACPHCDKVYVSMPAYSMHVRTHGRGCQCPYCGKRFSRPWLLQGHIRTHTGEKPFRCPQCGKAFADKSNLRAHVQTHSAEKPHVCARCGKAFALKSYLYKHEESSCMRGRHHRVGPTGRQQLQTQSADNILRLTAAIGAF